MSGFSRTYCGRSSRIAAIGVVLLSMLTISLTYPTPAHASGRTGWRVLEVPPVVARAEAVKYYALEVRGTARRGAGVLVSDFGVFYTDTISGGSIDITATFVRGAWRVTGTGELRVTTTVTNPFCRTVTHNRSSVLTVTAEGSNATGIKIFLFPKSLQATTYPCQLGDGPATPLPVVPAAVAFAALVVAEVMPFQLGGGVVKDFEGVGIGVLALKYDLTFTLVPYNVVFEQVGESVETAVAQRGEAAYVPLVASAAAGLYPVTPTRIADTRAGPDRVGPFSRLGGGQSIDVVVVGNAGVPEGAVAAVINATVTNPAGDGYLTLFPTGSARPLVSNLNFVAGQTVPNLVQVKLGTGGAVTVYNGGRDATEVILDVVGYYAPGGAMWVPSIPGRSFDLNVDSTGPVIAFMVPDNVNGAQVRAVARNVTIDAPSADGWLKAYPASASSLNSNLNFRGGQTVANAVISGSSGDFIDGQAAQAISYQVGPRVANARLIVDTLGRFVDEDGTGAGMFVALDPCRALDTRPTPDRRGDLAGPVQAGASVSIALAGRCGLPAAVSIDSVVMNVTVVNPTQNGYLTLWTAGESQPPTSTVNFTAGQVVPNHTIVYTSEAGAISASLSAGNTDVIIDVFGYYTA